METEKIDVQDLQDLKDIESRLDEVISNYHSPSLLQEIESHQLIKQILKYIKTGEK